MNRALEFLQAIYSNDELPLFTRVRVAIACLPFETPKLAVTAVVQENDFATLLDQRIKRYEQMKLIEAKPINGSHSIEDMKPDPDPAPAAPLPIPLNRLYSNRFRRRM